MTQMIANPKEMFAFARDLAVLSGELASRDRNLMSALGSLNRTWSDQRYAKFQRAAETNSLQLQIFFRKSENYVAYLQRKAKATQRYLGG